MILNLIDLVTASNFRVFHFTLWCSPGWLFMCWLNFALIVFRLFINTYSFLLECTQDIDLKAYPYTFNIGSKETVLERSHPYILEPIVNIIQGSLACIAQLLIMA